MRNSVPTHNRKALLAAVLASVFRPAVADPPFEIGREDVVMVRAETAWEDVTPDTLHFSGEFEMRVRDWRLLADRAMVQGPLENPAVVQLEGSPARLDLETRSAAGSEPVHAEAQRIVYLRERAVILLEGQARLTQGGNVLRSNSIEYEPETDRLRAFGETGVQIDVPGAE